MLKLSRCFLGGVVLGWWWKCSFDRPAVALDGGRVFLDGLDDGDAVSDETEAFWGWKGAV
jgi:hypothetical protein